MYYNTQLLIIVFFFFVFFLFSVFFVFIFLVILLKKISYNRLCFRSIHLIYART